jgi:MFS transporter, DHA1 family, tetracycline resistance protein
MHTRANHIRQAWSRRVEPWYVAYGLLGAALGGLVPIVIPLAVVRTGDVLDVGLVMAAFHLGGLAAPLWGGLADRYGGQRGLVIGGLLLTAMALAAFPWTTAPAAWIGLAVLGGLGGATATTLAPLFVVRVYPPAEWDERISWLHAFYDGGQVAGLLLAGGLSQVHVRGGLLTAAGLTVTAAVLAWLTTRTPLGPSSQSQERLRPARHGDVALAGLPGHGHQPTLDTLRQLRPALWSPFHCFLMAWLLALIGSSAFFALYPILMREVFAIAPALSSLTYAMAGGLRLLVYPHAGRWSLRFGQVRVLRAALGVRLLAFGSLLALAMMPLDGQRWLALPIVTVVVLAWPLLSVSSTALTAHLSPVAEGEGMGLYKAVSALAGVIGAALAGALAERWGYRASLGLAIAGVAVALVLSIQIRPVQAESTTSSD